METIKKLAIYKKSEALAYANELANEIGGRVKETIVGDPSEYSFDEIEQWSGECEALEILDGIRPVARIAYWDWES